MKVTMLPARQTVEILTLSAAEQAILPLLLAGEAERNIALILGKSPATVNKQVGSIYRAYSVSSKPELIARHYELEMRKILIKNGGAGVNTLLQPASPPLHNPPVARKTARRKK